MIVEHDGKVPEVHPDACVAPTAVVSGAVSLAADVRVLFGAVLTSEGGPVDVGAETIVMENAVLRGTARHPCRVGANVLVGPRAYLTGCTVRDASFLATGSTVFNGAEVGEGAEVRINGVVHVGSRLPAGETVPIGWVAVGDPVQLLPPARHEAIWDVQEELDFPGTVFGLEREENTEMMPKLTRRYGRALGKHREDRQRGDDHEPSEL